jgi:peroxiredoxin
MKILFVSLLTLLYGFFTMPAGDSGYKVGERARSFELKNVDGSMLSLEKAAGSKGAIVVFTCNHCPFSKMYEDRIIALNAKYSGKGYPVIAINPNDPKKQPDDSFDKMVERAKEKGFIFPYLLDETQGIAKAYGAARTPHVFILTKQGENFVVSYIGAIDDNANEAKDVKVKYVEAALDNLLAGRKPEPSKTKAIGCTIKWREV